jgi:hypothetical protein
MDITVNATEIRKADLTALEAAQELGIDLNRLYILLRLKRIEGRKDDQGNWRIPASAIAQRRAELAARHRSIRREMETALTRGRL